jgi:protein gp37
MARTGSRRKGARRSASPATAARRKSARRKSSRPLTRKRTATRYWSGRVTRESRALDLAAGVFTWKDPKRIAASLKRSAEASHRRKAEPYRSALSMLTFYINRAGKTLPVRQRRTLEMAKVELRKQFGRE